MEVLRSGWAEYGSTTLDVLNSSVGPASHLILATSAIALGAFSYFSWSNSEGNHRQTAQSDQSAYALLNKQNMDRIKQAYKYVLGGLVVTAASAMLAHISGISNFIFANMGVGFGLSVLSFGSLCWTNQTRYDQNNPLPKQVPWLVFTATMGLLFSPLGLLDQSIIVQAGVITLGMGTALTATAFMAKSERFLKWEGPLMATLTGLVVTSAIANFCPSTAFAYGVDRISLYGGLILFSGFMMVSTHKLVKAAKRINVTFDPINASLDIYLDIMSIFIRVVRIISENKKAKKRPQTAN